MRGVALSLVLLLTAGGLAQDAAPVTSAASSAATEKIHQQALHRLGKKTRVHYVNGGMIDGSITEATADHLILRSKDSGRSLEIPYGDVKKISAPMSAGKKVAIAAGVGLVALVLAGALVAGMGARM